jgi:hypothetical protein
MSSATTTTKVNPKTVLIILAVISLILISLSIWGQYLKYFPGTYDINGAWDEFMIDLLMQGFYVDLEANVPTYFNTIILFIPALFLGIIAAWKFSIKDKFKIHWAGLAFIFLYLSMDEAATLHERLIKPMRAIVDFEGYGGLFYFAWVIPGIAVVILFLLAYLRFFLHLENKYKILFFISIAAYVGGIIGGEMLSGRFAGTIGLKNFEYAMFASLEESLEWIGCSLIIYSLLLYIQQYLPEGITFKA